MKFCTPLCLMAEMNLVLSSRAGLRPLDTRSFGMPSVSTTTASRLYCWGRILGSTWYPNDTCFGSPRSSPLGTRYVQVIDFGAQHVRVTWRANGMAETSLVGRPTWYLDRCQVQSARSSSNQTSALFGCGLKHLKHFAMWTVQDYGPVSRSLHWWVVRSWTTWIWANVFWFLYIFVIFVSRLPLRSGSFYCGIEISTQNPQVWRSTSWRASLLAALEALRPAHGTSCEFDPKVARKKILWICCLIIILIYTMIDRI